MGVISRYPSPKRRLKLARSWKALIRTEILHELPPPMLIDMALVVAAAAEVAVPVAAMSIVVDVPISMWSIFEVEVPMKGGEGGMSQNWVACSPE